MPRIGSRKYNQKGEAYASPFWFWLFLEHPFFISLPSIISDRYTAKLVSAGDCESFKFRYLF